MELPLTISQYRETLTAPLRLATLAYLISNGEILLAMKKRSFGAGRWNGVGGKVQQGETIEDAVRRETREEVGVEPISLRPVARPNFYFPEVPRELDWDQQVGVYLVDRWSGIPKETEEMAPRWFRQRDIPYPQMWLGDIHWLPRVLAGEHLEAHILFGADQDLREWDVRELRTGELPVPDPPRQ